MYPIVEVSKPLFYGQRSNTSTVGYISTPSSRGDDPLVGSRLHYYNNGDVYNHMQNFTVKRLVEVHQAIVIKARSASEAKELARKTKFKDWTTLYNKKRTGYEASPLNA